ncbi:MAG: hypothetical protein AAF907_09280, partial [Planctomycetota bacterium]
MPPLSRLPSPREPLVAEQAVGGWRPSRLVGGRPDRAVWAVFFFWPFAALLGAGLSWPPGAAAALLMAVPAVWVGMRLTGPMAGMFAALAALCCASEATLLRVLRRLGEWYGLTIPGPADDRLFAP